MPKISFAAHISSREANDRRSRSPYLPGAAEQTWSVLRVAATRAP